MRLTGCTAFALRALMRMAARPDRGFTADEIARELASSRQHPTKLVNNLAHAGFVVTRRGGGGLGLARPPRDIRIGAAVRALESREALVDCFRPADGACRMTAGLTLKGRLAGAREAFLRHLDATPLAEGA